MPALLQACGAPRSDKLLPSGSDTSCTGLDTAYPYPPVPGFVGGDGALKVTDTPGAFLLPTNGERNFNQNSTMWLQFTPEANELFCGSASAACTLVVPVGSVNWTANGDAINTLKPQSVPNQQNTSTWILNSSCGTISNNTFVLRDKSVPYPSWSQTAVSKVSGCQGP
jgi:hypothetical protein